MLTSSPLPSKPLHPVLQITLTLLSKLDITVSQRGHDSTLDSTWSPPSASPARAPAWPRARQCARSPSSPRPSPALSSHLQPLLDVSKRLDIAIGPRSPCRRRPRHCPPPQYCRVARTLTTSTHPHFLRHRVSRTRNDVAYSPASSPGPLRHCTTVVDHDLPRSASATPNPIKRGIPWTLSAHQQVPLSLLNLLDSFPSPIKP
jgi:hypothetical protein